MTLHLSKYLECTVQVFGTSSGLRGNGGQGPGQDSMATIGCFAPLGQTCILGELGFYLILIFFVKSLFL